VGKAPQSRAIPLLAEGASESIMTTWALDKKSKICCGFGLNVCI
jgi:hypothetical protein